MFERRKIEIRTGSEGLENITSEVSDAVDRSEVDNGFCLLFCPHTTAGIMVNEDDPGLREDFLEAFGRMVPDSEDYRHDRVDNNATSHIKTVLAGSDHTLPVFNGSLELGTWQNILLVETDGPRRRTVEVYLMG